MKNTKKRILLVCNESNSTYNFRKELIIFLLKQNYEVFVSCSDCDRKNDIKRLGVNFFEIKFNNRSRNLLSLKRFEKELIKLIKELNPDIVFTFMLKPNIVGPVAAKKCEIDRIYSMVEGLGDPFQPKNIFQKIVRLVVSRLLKRSFLNCKKVFVLNNDDKNELVKRHILIKSKINVIPGIGIDCESVSPNYVLPSNKKVVMFARLIKSKGIIDYCNVAKYVKEKRSDISFELFGQEDELTKKDLSPFTEKGYLYYGGYTKNAINIMASSRIIVSTSFYREGMPRVILEAMRLGKPVIASNTVGSKEMVLSGKTGELFEMHNWRECGDKILEIIDNDSLLLEYGKNARKICEERYDSNIINKTIFEIINQ